MSSARSRTRRWPRSTSRTSATALDGVDVRPLDDALGRASGRLLAVAKASDVIDAALILLAEDGDHVVTSDPEDIATLAAAAGRSVEVVHV